MAVLAENQSELESAISGFLHFRSLTRRKMCGHLSSYIPRRLKCFGACPTSGDQWSRMTAYVLSAPTLSIITGLIKRRDEGGPLYEVRVYAIVRRFISNIRFYKLPSLLLFLPNMLLMLDHQLCKQLLLLLLQRRTRLCIWGISGHQSPFIAISPTDIENSGVSALGVRSIFISNYRVGIAKHLMFL